MGEMLPKLGRDGSRKPYSPLFDRSWDGTKLKGPPELHQLPPKPLYMPFGGMLLSCKLDFVHWVAPSFERGVSKMYKVQLM